jgi:hypothetical protein
MLLEVLIPAGLIGPISSQCQISVSPSPMRHIADDCLSALVHRDVLDPDGLIAYQSKSDRPLGHRETGQ